MPPISREFLGGRQYYDPITLLKMKKWNHKIAQFVEENWRPEHLG